MEIINQKKNALMNREEAWVMIDHGGRPTPPRKDIIADVARQFKAKEDCVIVDKIFSETGRPASRVKVLVYAKADAVPKAKLEKMQIRMGLKKKDEGKGGEGAPQAAPAGAAADKPAEEKKAESAKPEEKKPEGAKAEEKKEEPEAEEKKPGEKGG